MAYLRVEPVHIVPEVRWQDARVKAFHVLAKPAVDVKDECPETRDQARQVVQEGDIQGDALILGHRKKGARQGDGRHRVSPPYT